MLLLLKPSPQPMVPDLSLTESHLAEAREEFGGTQGIPRSVPEGKKAEDEVQCRKPIEQLSILRKYQIIKIIK